MSCYAYLVYGLHIASNQPVDGLPLQPIAKSVDVKLKILGPGPWHFDPIPDELLLNGIKRDGEQWHSLQIWRGEDALHVRYQLTGEQVDFAISPAGDHVQVIWSHNFPADDVPAFLLGPVIGCVLRLRGVLALHAGVVAVGDEAIAIIGDKGAGKSTLIGEFARQGFPILSDDVAPLFVQDNQILAHPGYPRLRLWPETLSFLGIPFHGLPKVESIFSKRYVDLSTSLEAADWRFINLPHPVKRIYWLAPRGESDGKNGAETPAIAPVAGQEKLNLLLQNCYVDYVLDQAGRTQQFRQLIQLASYLPIYRVSCPDDLTLLPNCVAALSALP